MKTLRNLVECMHSDLETYLESPENFNAAEYFQDVADAASEVLHMIDKQSEQWVILSYFPYSPVEVYGNFSTEKEARDYAEQQGFAAAEGMAYDVHMVRNVEETV